MVRAPTLSQVPNHPVPRRAEPLLNGNNGGPGGAGLRALPRRRSPHEGTVRYQTVITVVRGVRFAGRCRALARRAEGPSVIKR
jgi:hypothetical protein